MSLSDFGVRVSCESASQKKIEKTEREWERGRRGKLLYAVCVRSTESEIVEASLLLICVGTNRVWDGVVWYCGELWKQFINRNALEIRFNLDRINKRFLLFVYDAVRKCIIIWYVVL